MRRIRSRKHEGQSATEFALMLPVIVTTFFWVFQANIFMSAYHHSAYAAYASARTLLVKHDGQKDPNRTMQRILTGTLYTGASASEHSLGGAAADGVRVSLPSLQVFTTFLPSGLDFETRVPAHLGPDEWNKMVWGGDPRNYDDVCQNMFTDNNLCDNN